MDIKTNVMTQQAITDTSAIPIEFHYFFGKLGRIHRVPPEAMGIVGKHYPEFHKRLSPELNDDGTRSDFTELQADRIKALQDELTNAGFPWLTRAIDEEVRKKLEGQ
jgi:hypothetical protein